MGEFWSLVTTTGPAHGPAASAPNGSLLGMESQVPPETAESESPF